MSLSSNDKWFSACEEKSNNVDSECQILISIDMTSWFVRLGLGYGSGYCVNFADIVPAYSGVIFGLANTFASLAGLTGNLVAGVLVKKPILEQWRKLYIMFGIVYFIGGLVFLLFGTAVPRKWAKFQSANDKAQEQKLNDEEAMPMNEKESIKA